MDKMKELETFCKNGFRLEVDEHKVFYESASRYINNLFTKGFITKESLLDEVRNEIIKKDRLITLTIYPTSEAAFYFIHYDLNTIIDKALQTLKITNKIYKRKIIDKTEKLITHCKCGVFLEVNEQKREGTSIVDYLELEYAYNDYDEEDLPRSVARKIIKKNCLIKLQIFPDTPVGSYDFVHHDINKIINDALQVLKHNKD